MAFPKRLLADHEKIIFDLRPHWLSVVPPMLWTVVLLIVLIIAIRLVPEDAKGIGNVGWEVVLTAVALAAWVPLAVVPFLRWRFTSFVLTSDRLITRQGVVAKHSREIPLERINDVAFSQSVMERFLGAGDLMIESAGERGQTLIGNVRKPEQVQLAIYKEIESNNSKLGSSIAEQLEALHRLHQQGILSDDEYEAKRQEMMKRL